MKPRSAKAKGTKLEKWVMDAFNKLPGWLARKQPGSGIYQDFPHDVHAEHDIFGRWTVECKSWKHGWRTGDKAMGQADILVIKRDGTNQHDPAPPMVYMTFERFAQIVSLHDDVAAEPKIPQRANPWPKGRQIKSRGFRA